MIAGSASEGTKPMNSSIRRKHCAPLRPLSVAVVLACAAWAPAAGAQAAPITAPAPAVFPIKGFAIMGDNPLSSSETSVLLARYLRSDATLDVLQQATAALEKALQERGYSLYRVVLPPQPVSDTVTLNVVRFSLGKVEVQGNDEHFSDENIRRALPELRENGSPNLRKLARETAVANENPSRKLVVGLKQAEDSEAIHATVRVSEKAPWTVGVGLSNAGTRETGRDRFTLSGSYNNLFDRDHVVGAAYTTSLEKHSRVRQFGLNYRAPFYDLGGVAFASYIDSDVVGTFGLNSSASEFSTFTSTAAGSATRLGYAHYLMPSGGYRSYVTLSFEDKLFRATEVAGLPTTQSDRRSRPVTLGYAGRLESDRQVAVYSADLAFNVGGGRGNSLAAYRSENADVDTTHWKALRASATLSRAWVSNWQMMARVQAQYSPDILIAGEAFGLGGVGSIRGVPDRVLYGDSGYSVSLEAVTPELATGLRVLAFVDAGAVSSHIVDRPARRARDRLASVGLGLRYAHPSGASLSADYGRVVTGSRADQAENPSVPGKGDDKLHVSLSIFF